MRGVLAVVVLAIVGLAAWMSVGGQNTTVPKAPKVGVPNVGNPQDAANSAADGIEKLPPWVWHFAVPLVIVVLTLAWLKNKAPAFFWLACGVGAAILLVFATAK